MSQEDPIRHIAALWPEMPWPYANVLCEGPSIASLDPGHLLKGPVLAVNRAIKLAETLRVDFWAISDRPTLLWEWAEPYRKEGLRYFSTDQNILPFVPLIGEKRLEKVYTTAPTAIQATKKGYVILPTIVPLLGWLLRQGVRRVRVFGADMTGYGTPILNDYVKESEKARGRWIVERVLFSEAIRAYRERGATLERWPKKRLRRR